MKRILAAAALLAALLPSVAWAQAGQGPAVIVYPTTAGHCLNVASRGGGYISDTGAPCASGTPSGSAGGDLGGTYPNPTVLSVTHVTTGVLPAANGGAGATSGLLKANGLGTVSAAVSGTDYAPATGIPTASLALAHNGNGATRQYMAVAGTNALQNAMTRGMFWWRQETATGPNVQVSPCRINTTGDELCYANTTFKVAIYNATAGTNTQCGSVTTSTVATVSCANVTLVRGKQYAACMYVSSANGITYYQSLSNSGLSTQDGVAFGTTGSPATDNTANCAAVPDGSGNHKQAIFPVGIIAPTLMPTFCEIGDSRIAGYNAVWDQSGDIGDNNPSVGARYGYVQMAGAATFATGYISGHANRDLIIAGAGCTTLNNEYGINDITANAASAATVAGYRTTMAGFYPNVKVIGSTMMTETTSTDNFATNSFSTLNNQTCSGSGCTVVQSFNTLERAGISGEAAFWDGMKAFDPSITGFWCINYLPSAPTGSANFCTLDGTHAAVQGEILLKNSGLINLGYLQ